MDLVNKTKGPQRSALNQFLNTYIFSDATLFELDPVNIHNLSLSSAELNRLMTSVVICARAAQPSVIYIKHIQRLFYKKVNYSSSTTTYYVMTSFELYWGNIDL